MEKHSPKHMFPAVHLQSAGAGEPWGQGAGSDTDPHPNWAFWGGVLSESGCRVPGDGHTCPAGLLFPPFLLAFGSIKTSNIWDPGLDFFLLCGPLASKPQPLLQLAAQLSLSTLHPPALSAPPPPAQTLPAHHPSVSTFLWALHHGRKYQWPRRSTRNYQVLLSEARIRGLESSGESTPGPLSLSLQTSQGLPEAPAAFLSSSVPHHSLRTGPSTVFGHSVASWP